MIYKFTGTWREINAIGIFEPFKVYIRAEGKERAILRLYDRHDHIQFKTEFEMDEISWTKINHDVNGNPRYVCHYLSFIPDWIKFQGSDNYKIALDRARKLGGRKFHNKQFGGGIVFCTYSLHDLENSIIDLWESVLQNK